MFWRDGVPQALLPSLLHLQNAIDQITVASLLGKSQGCVKVLPLLCCTEFSLPRRNHSGMQIHPRGQGDEVTHVHHSFSRYARFTGPSRQSWAQVFINQELQGAAAQPRWRSSALRGRPGGLGMRA